MAQAFGTYRTRSEREPGLIQDRLLRADPQRISVERNDDHPVLFAELAVAPAAMNNDKPAAFQQLDHLLAREALDSRAHAASTVTSKLVTTG